MLRKLKGPSDTLFFARSNRRPIRSPRSFIVTPLRFVECVPRFIHPTGDIGRNFRRSSERESALVQYTAPGAVPLSPWLTMYFLLRLPGHIVTFLSFSPPKIRHRSAVLIPKGVCQLSPLSGAMMSYFVFHCLHIHILIAFLRFVATV